MVHGELRDMLVTPAPPPAGETRWFHAVGTCGCGWNVGGEGPTPHRAATGLRMAWLQHTLNPA